MQSKISPIGSIKCHSKWHSQILEDSSTTSLPATLFLRSIMYIQQNLPLQYTLPYTRSLSGNVLVRSLSWHCLMVATGNISSLVVQHCSFHVVPTWLVRVLRLARPCLLRASYIVQTEIGQLVISCHARLIVVTDLLSVCRYVVLHGVVRATYDARYSTVRTCMVRTVYLVMVPGRVWYNNQC